MSRLIRQAARRYIDSNDVSNERARLMVDLIAELADATVTIEQQKAEIEALQNPDGFGDVVEEMDIESFLNLRDWFEKLIGDAGGVITDAGIGVGRADIGFELNGAPFSMSVKPRPFPLPPPTMRNRE